MRIPRGVLAPVAFVAVLLLVPTGSSLAQVNANDIVGGTISATASAGDPTLVTPIYNVPAGRGLVLTDFEYAVVLHADQFGSSLETPVVLLQGVMEKWGSVWFGVSVP